MKQIEKYIKEHCNDAYTIENLPERMRGEYIDFDYKGKCTIQIFNKIAEDLSNKFTQFTFSEESDDQSHPSLHCEDNLVKKLGVDSIVLCPYKGYEISSDDLMCDPYESNYILMIHTCQNEKSEENSEYERSTLFIDVYNTYKKTKKEIYSNIIQELYNLKRDVEWVNKGIYEEKMEKMSYEASEIQHQKMMENPFYREFFKELNDLDI